MVDNRPALRCASRSRSLACSFPEQKATTQTHCTMADTTAGCRAGAATCKAKARSGSRKPAEFRRTSANGARTCHAARPLALPLPMRSRVLDSFQIDLGSGQTNRPSQIACGVHYGSKATPCFSRDGWARVSRASPAIEPNTVPRGSIAKHLISWPAFFEQPG